MNDFPYNNAKHVPGYSVQMFSGFLLKTGCTQKLLRTSALWIAPLVLCIVPLVLLSACAAPQESAGTGTPISFSALLGQYEKLTDSRRIDSLEAIINSGTTSPADRQQACYMLARLLQKSGDAKDAQRAIQLYQSAGDQSALWRRCQLHIAECAAITGQEETARSALNALISSGDTNLNEKAQARYSLAQSYLRAGEKDNAQKTFENVQTHFPKTEYATGALYYLGTISGNINYFRKYLEISPDGHFASDIMQQLKATPAYAPTAHDLALFAYVFYRQGKYRQALDSWAQSHSDMHFVGQAVCKVKLGDNAAARQVLLSGIYAHPNSAYVVPAAQLYSSLSSRDQAVKIWQVVLKTSPGNADAALWNLAAREDMPGALALYRTLVQKYPGSKFAADATWWLIWWHGGDNTKNAIAQLRSALKRYGQSKAAPRFAFWIGRCEEELNQPGQAKASYLWASRQFPSSYYGYRARARLLKLNGGSDPGWRTGMTGCSAGTNWDWPDEPGEIKFEDVSSKCGYTVAALTMLKQWDEVLQIMPKMQDPVVSALCLANLNFPLEAINAAAANMQGPARFDVRWQFAYPLLYGKLVSANAISKHIDPCLIHALIREESRYYSRAVSSSNALGLMQLLPSTAKITAATCGIPLTSVQDCFNPDKNICLGTTYFASLHQRFNGNDLLAVAAYNGGPNAVKSWRAKLSNPDAFVENIPIDETRDYVRKVFAGYWNYKQIYDNNF